MQLGDPNYIAEMLRMPHEGHSTPVKFLRTDEKRAPFLTTIHGGSFIQEMTGQPISGEHMIFVIGTNGQLYVNHKIRGRFQHSSFFAGGPIKSAGLVTLSGGRLLDYLPSSGHYLTDKKAMFVALDYFKHHGIDVTKFNYNIHNAEFPDWQKWYEAYLARDSAADTSVPTAAGPAPQQ